jgi:hypothetical protein
MTGGYEPAPKKPQRASGGMQAPGPVAVSKAPKKKKLGAGDMANDQLEVYGDDPSQDYVGMNGMEGHLENLQQAAYESDPYGFQPRDY